jgi:hypothetical protein
MKKYLIYIATGIITISIGSCSKFLKNTPENVVLSQTLDYTNTSASSMYATVSGVYANLASQGGGVSYNNISQPNDGIAHWASWMLYNTRSIDIDKGGAPGDQPEYGDIHNFNYTNVATNWSGYYGWNCAYNCIYTANYALDALGKFAANCTSDVDKTNNAKYQGEVRVLRDLCWFYGIRLWGLALMSSDNAALASSTLMPLKGNDAYQYLLNDLNTAIPALPAIAPSQQTDHPGAVTALTAHLLKAKIFMDMAGSDNTSPYLDSVIVETNAVIATGACSLYPDYYELYKIPGKLCSESLYEMQFNVNATMSNPVVIDNAWFACQGPGTMIGSPNGVNPGGIYGTWQSFMEPNATFVGFLSDRNDTLRARTDVINLQQYTDVDSSVTGIANAKYGVTTEGDIMINPTNNIYCNGKGYTPSTQGQFNNFNYGANNNIRVLRYADVLLLYAEAALRKPGAGGSTAANAKTYLNEVQSRAKIAPTANPTVKDVLEERRAEFWCEWGDQFFDVARLGTAYLTGIGYDGIPVGYDDSKRYLPIPASAIASNPNLPVGVQ